MGAILYWFLPLSIYGYATLIIFLFFLGVWGSGSTEGFWGHDPPEVAIDELVGFLVAVFGFSKTPGILILSFFLFRIFDIFKPFPVARSQKLRGGWGVMVDDLLAGAYTNLLIRLGLLIKG